ncbi:GlsB/YeaQ/YmgE family stress response membrane protein [Mycobacterium sp. ITM-2016-00318]|uniref:GlsB/YeaQ/YmgE family stress response membrane protein n=1 Tax=Mycobacterium sp. ITM-2016-00318 TaxID=2099693 RepID=UPI000CFA528D|nr:GlsB/YeaQ/YmgE family stress response membrane protein [Mycobacterium sp. ITM-2016-00318]WNG93056.1 GlsB/YeaQ/YmgE family stress response membrane protein [Mycobacterium sp. ITM-2016-00318]
MIGTILSALIVGLIVGALARLIMPGKQNIGVIMTIILGALGSFIGSWLTYQLGYQNSNGGWQVIPFLVGIIVAIILIAVYVGITGRRATRTTRTTPTAR